MSAAVTYTRLLMRARKLLIGCLPPNSLGLVPGASRAVAGISRLLRRHIVPQQVAWVQVQDGFGKGLWMQFNLSTERAWWSGEHERSIQRALQQLLSPQKIMYDVGAHVGFHALPAARLGAQVVAFEPDPENAGRLRANVDRNTLGDKVRVVEAAVWSNTGTSVAFRRGLPRSQGGVCSNDHQPVLASGEIIEVTTLALDDFVARAGPVPNVIKIDVEGGESEVLRGAAAILKAYRPALIIEVHTHSQYEVVRELLSFYSYIPDWDVPTENFPRQCFAAARSDPDRHPV